MEELAYLLFETPGTRVDPKGDGRVEVPRSMIFLMKWNKKKVINIFARPGILYLTSGSSCGDGREAQFVGRVAVSMDRVRIPLSCLKKAGIDKRRIVLSVEINGSSGIVVARMDRMSAAKSLLKWTAKWQIAAKELESILLSKHPETDVPIPELIVPSHEFPTIVRIIGKPHKMFGKWVSHKYKSTITLQSGGDVFYLIPVLRKVGCDWRPGWLLSTDRLMSELGRIVTAHQKINLASHDFNIIIFYSPLSFCWFDVFVDPKDPLDGDIVEIGMKSCSDFNSFVLETFGRSVDMEEGVHFFPPPLAITTRNFDLELI